MKVKYKMTILLIVSSFLTISCGHIPSNAILKLPPKLIIPTISASEVSCLTDNVFNKIKKRDKLKSARIQTLRNIIKSTH